jgi:Flp pilus assembly protein TadD
MFRKALAINPKMPLSLGGLGKVCVRKGSPREAISYFKRAIAIQPDSANLRVQLGQAYLKAGLRAEAEKQFAAARKLQAQVREKQEGNLFGKLPAPQVPAP